MTRNESTECRLNRTPFTVDKPWGYELWWGNTKSYLGKLLFIEAGHQSSIHFHQYKEESMYVHAGIMSLEIYELQGDMAVPVKIKEYTLGPGEAIDIPAGVIHSIVAKADLDLFEASTAYPQDSCRVMDPYDRDEK